MSYAKVAEQIKTIERQLEAYTKAREEKAMSGNSPFKYYSELKLKREAKIEVEKRKCEAKIEALEEKCEAEIEEAKKRRDKKIKELEDKFELMKEEAQEKANEFGRAAEEHLNRIPKSKVEIELELKLADLKPAMERLKVDEKEDNYTTQLAYIERTDIRKQNEINCHLRSLEIRRQNLLLEITNHQMSGDEIPNSLIREAHEIANQAKKYQEEKKEIHRRAMAEREALKVQLPEEAKKIESLLKQIDEDSKIPLEERLNYNKEFYKRHPEAEAMERAWQLERAKLMGQSE